MDTQEQLKGIVFLSIAISLLYYARRSNKKNSSNKNSIKTIIKPMAIILVISVVIVLTLSYIDKLITDYTNTLKIEHFGKNKELICSSKSISSYFVSIKEGWSIYEDRYFKKADLLIDISACKTDK